MPPWWQMAGLAVLVMLLLLAFARPLPAAVPDPATWQPSNDLERVVRDDLAQQLVESGWDTAQALQQADWMCGQARIDYPDQDLEWTKAVLADMQAFLEPLP